MPELGTPAGFDFFLKDNAGLGHEALHRGAQPVPRRGRAEQAAGQRAPERPGRHAAVPHRHRHGEGRRAGPVDRRHQRDAVDRLGRPVHRRLHRPRPRQARLSCRPMRRSAWCPEDFKLLVGAQRRRARWCRSRPSRSSRWDYGSPRLERYNGVPAMEIQGEARAGRELGRRDGRSRAAGRRSCRAGFGIEWTGAVLPGAPGRRADAAAVRAVAADRVPVPRRAVRELDDPDRGAAGGAAGHPRRRARPTRCAAWSATSTSRWRC